MHVMHRLTDPRPSGAMGAAWPTVRWVPPL
jgi:hypothetical protein